MREIKLLVADDEQMVRTFVKSVIEKEKLPVAQVLEADNGVDAIHLAQQYRPELVFLDIRMPGCDGLRVAERIIEENKSTQIIIISAYNDFEYARTALRVGVADYLLKPVRPNEIARLITCAAGQAFTTVKADDTKKASLVEAVESFVEKNLESSIQLKDIAAAVFVSPSHLSKMFKQYTGKSLVDYIQEVRLLAAEKLLRDTDLTITEIAGKVGFNDAAYFATCFKNHMEITPLQFRKTYLKQRK